MGVETQTGPNGETFILDGGRWRQATPEEETVLQSDSLSRFGAQLGARAMDTLDLAVGLVTPRLGMGPSLDRIGERGQAMEPLERLSPDTGMAASAALELPFLGAGMATAPASRAIRAATQISSRGASARASVAGGLRSPSGLIQRPSNVLGRGTAAGQTARTLEAGLEAIPGPNLILLQQKALNQRTMNEGLARAMQLSDDLALAARTEGFSGRHVAATLDNFARDYRAVSAPLDEFADQAAVRKWIDLADTKGYLGLKLGELVKKPRLTGRQIMQVRSSLARRAASQKDLTVADDMDFIVGKLDGEAARAMERAGDTEAAAGLASVNARYRLWRNMRKGRAIGKDGMVNPSAADFRFSSSFGDQYMAGRVQTADEGVNNFLKLTREGAELDVGLQSSGTTERAVAAILLGGGAVAASQ